MFAATLTLTIGGVARTLIRQNQDNFGSVYSFEDAAEIITMKIRHSTDTGVSSVDPISGKLPVKRHNVYLERRIYATPSATEKLFTCTVTLRNREGAAPADLLATWIGLNTLVLTLDDGLVVGEN